MRLDRARVVDRLVLDQAHQQRVPVQAVEQRVLDQVLDKLLDLVFVREEPEFE
ncbi:hypothetical protein AVDCRST_MAG81-585 [uncultured Synechococcales cyanobacterium]|uniref:Uncharacterized protein n=1 Tax=uncultured Synechococcales cyanobacterium TaxID=1936017 RepID=A0A6J4UV26_9CYAN|nr:hypothetical protein AVDCRST_MAG81-585 [uncultured Synechococcales cyanobacterium]